MPDDVTQAPIDDPAIEAVEIKLTVRSDQEAMVFASLEGTDAEPQKREVYFFDDDDLTLYESGLVLRARKVHGDTDNTTVKLRPVTPDQVAERRKKQDDFAIEIDAVGEKVVCSAKLDADQGQGEIDAWIAGEREASKLLTKEQEELIRQYAPVQVDWTAMRPLGPIDVRKWEIQPEHLDDEITIEEWTLPDGSNLLELSIKVSPDDAEEAAEKFRAFLAERALDVEGDQQTKTKVALAYFTGHEPA
jgi:hypothetical protein